MTQGDVEGLEQCAKDSRKRLADNGISEEEIDLFKKAKKNPEILESSHALSFWLADEHVPGTWALLDPRIQNLCEFLGTTCPYSFERQYKGLVNASDLFSSPDFLDTAKKQIEDQLEIHELVMIEERLEKIVALKKRHAGEIRDLVRAPLKIHNPNSPKITKDEI
jgi:hypothetical protein